MKYLKLFENHKYYHEIEGIEYDNITGINDDDDDVSEVVKRRHDEFTDDEIKLIEDIKPNLKVEDVDSIGIYTAAGDINDISQKKTVILVKEQNKMVRTRYGLRIWSCAITKLKDEWYVVYVDETDKFYKCDQFSGLLELLKTLVI